nr:hypothetical protein CFP56_00089 [Quercus suber]
MRASGSGFSRDSQTFPNGFPYPDLVPAIWVIPGIGSFHEGLCYFHGGLATQNLLDNADQPPCFLCCSCFFW